ncbi:DUF551 domain-containing protein [Rodentibacter caecimuris]|nr:DUF551 domain-containing protein [Rodentibacter heylii]
MSENNNGWISVEDRLPDNFQQVLCCNHLCIFVAERVNDKWFTQM